MINIGYKHFGQAFSLHLLFKKRGGVMVFWGIFTTIMLVGIIRVIKPVLTWKWSGIQLNLGIDYAKLSPELQDYFTVVKNTAHKNNTTTENELVLLIFLIFEKHDLSHEALAPAWKLCEAINFITAKLQANPSMQIIGDMYLRKLMFALYEKEELIKEETEEKAQLAYLANFINEYLLKYNIEHRLEMLSAFDQAGN